jgi:hypothetical protein
LDGGNHDTLSNVTADIFDYDDVLCLPPATEKIEASARILGVSSDFYQVLWGRNRDASDRGDISPEPIGIALRRKPGAAWMPPPPRTQSIRYGHVEPA